MPTLFSPVGRPRPTLRRQGPTAPGRWLARLAAAALLLAAPAGASPQPSLGYARPELLVSTAWLAANLDNRGIRIVDMRRNGLADYARGHVPGAVNLLNDEIRDPKSPPTFLPSVAAFEALMSRLGISNGTRVIVYDDRGGIYAARFWWILNYFGHADAALLDGGWTAWTKESRAVTPDAPTVAPARFVAKVDPRWIATADDVRAAIGREGVRIVDARTKAERDGTDLRGIRRGGYIPSAVPVYWEDALHPETQTFKGAAELARLYREAGVQPRDEVIVYCQVGMRASHDLFVLRLLGYDRLRNYYGAWEEWGNRDDLPIVAPGRPPKP